MYDIHCPDGEAIPIKDECGCVLRYECKERRFCEESDGGLDIHEYGCAESGDQRLCDHCNNDGTLTEKYCDNDGIINAKTGECPSGYECLEGECVGTAEPVCWESDDGYDIYNHGVVELDNARKEDYCDGDVIIEYFCEGGEIGIEDFICEHGCIEGACRLATCAEEGEYTSGPVAPEYSYYCCDGLIGFETSDLIGGGLLCYDPQKGEPICLGQGTDDEGWYYPSNESLKQGACAVQLPDLVIESIELEESVSGTIGSYQYTVYVKNIGDSYAGPSYVKVEVDPLQPQSIDDGESYICYDGHTAPVPQNDMVSGEILEPGVRERNFDYFNPVYTGNVTITAKADIYDQVPESDEENNIMTRSFSIDTAKINISECPNGCISGSC
jgi:hypothetical protein